MKKQTGLFLLAVVVALSFFLLPRQPVQATSPEQLALISELTGMAAHDTAVDSSCSYSQQHGVFLCAEPVPAVLPVPDPDDRARAMELLRGGSGLILIVESTNRRVMAFHPVTGDLVDANFIPADATNLSTPIELIVGPNNTFLISDQIRDWVFEYALDGTPLGMFAGGNVAILDNIRGIALRPNGNLLVTVGGGANMDAVAQFDTTGAFIGNFVAPLYGGLDSPFDVYGRLNDWLVAGIDSDQIHRYQLDGTYIDNLMPINTFPEQIAEASNGNVLVANFSPGTNEGVLEFTATGTFVGRYDPAPLTGYRGVYELPNGNFLTTTGTGVHEISRANTLVSTKISGVSGRFITFFSPMSVGLTKTVGTDAAACAPTANIAVATGTDVHFCLTITNSGFVTVTNHTIADPTLGIQVTIPYTLSPGASVALTSTVIPALGPVTVNAPIVNTAVVTGTAGALSATSTSTATVSTVGLGIAVTKTVGLSDTTCGTSSTLNINLGTPVYYCFTIENQSEITVTNVAVSDPLLNYTANINTPQAPGAVLELIGVGPYTPTEMITNTVYVTGTTDVGDVMANSSALVIPAPTDVTLTQFGGQGGEWRWAAAALLIVALGWVFWRRQVRA
ncbi:MAG: hypothetical protein KJ063_12435 [Anaerolineae bacterium]|nr:hypothetical protein [Anaerolineae bacterium]